MSNLSTSWGFVLRDSGNGERQNVRVKVPNRIPQWLALRTDVPAGERCLLALQDIVRRNAWKLFPGTEIEHATLFRVSRNADVALEDGADYSLRESVEEQVRQRRFQPVVRLEFSESPWPEVRDELMQRFELHEADVYELPGQLDYTTFFEIASLPVPELRDKPWTPVIPPLLGDGTDLFEVIRAGDVLVTIPTRASMRRWSASSATPPTILQ